ncbi:Vsp/OspC family lipoprotein (plasmid) [Borrelia puertoricensis]|uniref:Vsp/OspC family lipoprotein n=1 Tax=Borrelia puertoricensis TaxID=2756107 RepID=UPI003EBED7DD
MKRITLCALFLTLFLLISCNTSGAATNDGQAAKSDGTIIDLVTITKNIKDSVAFAKDVTEIHTLVKSINELAKAIGKKIKDSATELDNQVNKNASLLSGAFTIVLHVKNKLAQLEKKEGLSEDLKAKITVATTSNTNFLNKLKENNADLGKDGVTDEDAKKAILLSHNDKTKGAKELGELNTAIDALVIAANDVVTSAIKELTTSTKPSNT